LEGVSLTGTAVSLRRQRNGGTYQMKTADFAEPSQPLGDNPSSTIFDGPPSPPRRYYNSAGNFNRIPLVLAKPKPAPFDKGAFFNKKP